MIIMKNIVSRAKGRDLNYFLEVLRFFWILCSFLSLLTCSFIFRFSLCLKKPHDMTQGGKERALPRQILSIFNIMLVLSELAHSRLLERLTNLGFLSFCTCEQWSRVDAKPPFCYWSSRTWICWRRLSVRIGLWKCCRDLCRWFFTEVAPGDWRNSVSSKCWWSMTFGWWSAFDFSESWDSVL